MEHETILKMIEEVDPVDTAKLDEIDARVDALVHGGTAYQYTVGPENEFTVWGVKNSGKPRTNKSGYVSVTEIPKYSRSRDALKAIRPEGWRWVVGTNNTAGGYKSDAQYHCSLYNGRHEVEYVHDFPTEELAELHAIIQAIAYERTTK